MILTSACDEKHLSDITIAMQNLNYASNREKVYKREERSHYMYSYKCEARSFINSLAPNKHFKSRLTRDVRKVIKLLADPMQLLVVPIFGHQLQLYNPIEVNIAEKAKIVKPGAMRTPRVTKNSLQKERKMNNSASPSPHKEGKMETGKDETQSVRVMVHRGESSKCQLFLNKLQTQQPITLPNFQVTLSNMVFLNKGTAAFLSKTLKEIRYDIVSKVGELLPQNFKFVRMGIPVSAIQEEKLHLQKCVEEEESGTAFSLSIQVHNSLEKNNSREISTQSSNRKSVSLIPPSALKDSQDAFEKTSKQVQREVELLEDDMLNFIRLKKSLYIDPGMVKPTSPVRAAITKFQNLALYPHAEETMIVAYWQYIQITKLR
ncbi:hypothetical protein ACROYT_G006356 [Oculina patagonica]